MGCLQSQESKVHAAEVAQQKARMSLTMSRLEKALKVKREEHQKELEKISSTQGAKGHGRGTMTLESILMRFRKVKHAVDLVKSAFLKNASEDNSLNFEGLTKAMEILHGQMSENDIKNVFEFVDLDASHSISMKEFLVALTVGYCLDMVPEVKADPNAAPETAAANTAAAVTAAGGGSNGSGHKGLSVATEASRTKEIKEMLNLVVNAYLLFDPDGKGHIVKGSLEKVMGDAGASQAKKKNSSATGGGFLSQDKWNEMDWDANGTIDFAEFVFSFASWVDLDEELDDDNVEAKRDVQGALPNRFNTAGVSSSSASPKNGGGNGGFMK